jgi:hypothetical protein
MELKDYLLIELDGLERQLKRVTDGLTHSEVCWQPDRGCNSIGLILYHMARSEDMFVQTRLRQTTEIWEAEKYWEPLNVSKEEAGAHYTPEEVDRFPVSDLPETMKYLEAVRKATRDYVKNLKPEDFDRMIAMGGPFGEMSEAAILSIVVTHTAEHLGEISYLRGLQRGQEAPPPPPPSD